MRTAATKQGGSGENDRERWPLALAVAVASLLLAAAVGVSATTGLSADLLFRDLAAVMRAHPLTGVIATGGAVGFLLAGALALFAVAVGPVAPGDRGADAGYVWSRGRAYALLLGVGSLVLGVDDLFLVHDDLLFRYLGLDEKVLVAAYGIGAIAVAVLFRDRLGQGGPAPAGGGRRGPGPVGGDRCLAAAVGLALELRDRGRPEAAGHRVLARLLRHGGGSGAAGGAGA